MYQPVDAEVRFVYRCKRCDEEHIVEYKDVKFPGGVLCYCGEKIQFRNMNRVRVKVQWGKRQSYTREQLSPRYNEVVAALRSLGHKAAEAKEMAKGYKNSNKSTEEILKLIFQKGKK